MSSPGNNIMMTYQDTLKYLNSLQLVFMVGSAEGVKKETYKDGPDLNPGGLMQYMNDGDVIHGKVRSTGELVVAAQKIKYNDYRLIQEAKIVQISSPTLADSAKPLSCD